MKVFVIIVHFGDFSLTKKCIESLIRYDNFPKKIIVINNSVDKINFGDRKITVISNKKNLGFAKAVNIGIKYALSKKAKNILLLNNDTKIYKNFLKLLVKDFQDNHLGIIGPAIEFYIQGKKVFDVGGFINSFTFQTKHKEVRRIINKEPHNVDYLSGCCMLIKKEVFNKTGFFDERFFMYFEDVDFCIRTKNNGFKVEVEPGVSIHHSLSASERRKSNINLFNLLKSRILFNRKYERNFFQSVILKILVIIQAFLFLKTNTKSSLLLIKALLS